MNIHDVGVAQGKHPLSTRNHYFEIEIVEPGQHCYIAIGLIHKVSCLVKTLSFSNK